ncbi:hydantoinase B/oxoprolinase family protein [Oscillospiraceae bacterium OttesenSCG-928-G22]|nr:hydantoinase B/oxoprolinase family protein [Oscillospiraceae bacterium OttesenSCG-928-G22]
MSAKQIDQITLDIIRDTFQAIGEEMFISTARASKSPVIYEVLDFASGLTNHRGDLLTQGNGITGFVGMLSTMVHEVLLRFNGGADLVDGDIILCNDPYAGGGSHLSDVGLVMPIFFDGEIVAYSVNKAHWTEVGGKNPGSWSSDATEVYQEGILFPFVKIFKAGSIDNDLLNIIKENVRTPDLSVGDMMAQIAGLRTGQKRMLELCEKFSVETVQFAIDKFLKASEEISKKKVLEIPEGEYTAVEYVDDDGLSDDPIKIQVKVTIKDGRFIVDYTGTDPQVSGPINTSYAALSSGVRTIFLASTDPSQDVNDGVFKPIEIIAEEGSILNCQKPASVSICWESELMSIDVVQKALAPIVPDKLVAANHTTVGAFNFQVWHPDHKEYNINVAPSLAGWGAGRGFDGQSGQFSTGNGESFNIPVEILESKYGFHVDEYCFVTQIDGAGAGEFRGGAGVRRAYRMRSDGSYFTGSLGRSKFPPWGLAGGNEGSRNYFEVLKKDGSVEGPFGKMAQYPLKEGDAIVFNTSIGGGYGNPLMRSVEKVEMDAKDEFISVREAEAVYGVILDPKTFKATGITEARKALEN